MVRCVTDFGRLRADRRLDTVVPLLRGLSRNAGFQSVIVCLGRVRHLALVSAHYDAVIWYLVAMSSAALLLWRVDCSRVSWRCPVTFTAALLLFSDVHLSGTRRCQSGHQLLVILSQLADGRLEAIIVVDHDVDAGRIFGDRVGEILDLLWHEWRLVVIVELVAGQLVVDEELVLDNRCLAVL